MTINMTSKKDKTSFPTMTHPLAKAEWLSAFLPLEEKGRWAYPAYYPGPSSSHVGEGAWASSSLVQEAG